MSEQSVSVRKWIAEFDNGNYQANNRSTQILAGWYDWFCDDSKLAEKTMKLGEIIKLISQSSKINIDTMYVWFKNNCPVDGPLYDDFRFADLETGDVIFTITPNSGHTGFAEVWGKENDFDNVIVEGNMQNIYQYFGVIGFTQYDNYENEVEENWEDEDDERCYDCDELMYNCTCDDNFDEDEQN